MKTTWFALCAMASSYCCMAQETIDPAIVNKILQAEFSSSHIPEIAQGITDLTGGRLTGSTSYKRAADWAMTAFQQWHMSNVAYEPWGTFGVQWEAENFQLDAVSPYHFSLHAYPVPWSPGTGNGLQGNVTTIGQEQSIDSAWIQSHSTQLKGKFLLVHSRPLNPEKNFKPLAKRYSATDLDSIKDMYMISAEQMHTYSGHFQKLSGCRKLMKQLGVLGVINVLPNSDNGAVMSQASYGYKKSNPMVLPEANIAHEDAQRIERLIAAGNKVMLKFNLKVKTSANEIPGHNVVAELKGSNDGLVMLGAHFDSWIAATGATDNAAGCIVMMEAVRLLDSLKLVPGRTIRVVLWDGEEQGLLGSYNYTLNHFRDSKGVKPAQEKVSAYFNLDNGTGKIRGIFAQSNPAVQPIFEKWLAPFDTLGATKVTLHNTGATDHLSLDWAGIPAFQFIQDPIDYETKTHHTSLDDYDHLQIDDLKQAAAIIACLAYQASIRKDNLPRKELDTAPFIFKDF